MTDINISLLIPGYLSPSRLEGHTFAGDVTSCPAAMQWRNTGEQVPWQVALYRLLCSVESSELCLPAARLLQTDPASGQFIVRADPVHLQADRDTAKLLPRQMLNLEESESDAFLITLNEFLVVDSLRIDRGPDDGWYLTGMDASALESYPPSFLANRNASAFLPSGDGSERWRRLMTEIQMLLHSHPVNEQRTQQGQLPINSLWFWGGGQLPVCQPGVVSDASQPPTVYANDEFSKALCSHLGTQCFGIDQFDPLTTEQAIVVDTRIASAHFSRDEAALQQATRCVDVDWLSALVERLRQGDVSQITLSNEDGEVGHLNMEGQKAHDRKESFWGQSLQRVLGWFTRG